MRASSGRGARPALRLAGIPIRIHFSFLLLVVWYGAISARRGAPVVASILFLLLLFACVLLHELGHALMARRFGVRTREIVLYPIGGVARLEGISTGLPELAISLAGPAVNLALAGGLVAALFVADGGWPEAEPLLSGEELISQLLLANLLLFLFNLLPAFPMDGGRVLRALLSLAMDELPATLVATRIGQACAVGFALLGLVGGNPILILIALFVFFGAGRELAYFRARAAMRGVRAGEVMRTRFAALRPEDRLEQAAELALEAGEGDLPVVDARGGLRGVLRRRELVEGLSRGAGAELVDDHLDRDPPTASPETELLTLIPLLRRRLLVPVLSERALVGLLDVEHLSPALELVGRAAETEGAAEASEQESRRPATGGSDGGPGVDSTTSPFPNSSAQGRKE